MASSLDSIRFLGEDAHGADWIGFQSIVEPLSERIITGPSQQSYTVAILGSWGCGKTTLLRLLDAELQKQERDQRRDISGSSKEKKDIPHPLTVWFDAWRYETSEDIWKGLITVFYRCVKDNQSLYEEYRRKRPRITREIAKFSAALLDRILGFATPLGALVDAVATERWSPTLHHEFDEAVQEILTTLRGAGQDRPIVLFIDDIDRCSDAAAVAVLLATKQVLNKPGMVVVLAVSPEQIERAVANLALRHGGEPGGRAETDAVRVRTFLRKFIQVPIPVPPLSRFEFEGFLARCFAEAGVSHYAEYLQEPQWIRWIASQFTTANLREAKSFVNAYAGALLRAGVSPLPWFGQAGGEVFQQKQLFITLMHQQHESAWRHFSTVDSGPADLMYWQRWISAGGTQNLPNRDLLTEDSCLGSFLMEALRSPGGLIPLFEGATDVERHLRLSNSVPRDSPQGEENESGSPESPSAPPPVQSLMAACDRLPAGAFRGSLADVRLSRWAPRADLDQLERGTPATVGNDLGEIITFAQALGHHAWCKAMLSKGAEASPEQTRGAGPRPIGSAVVRYTLELRQSILDGTDEDLDRRRTQLIDDERDVIAYLRALETLYTAYAVQGNEDRALDIGARAIQVATQNKLEDTAEFLRFCLWCRNQADLPALSRPDLQLMAAARRDEGVKGGHVFVSVSPQELTFARDALRQLRAKTPIANYVIHGGVLPFRATWLEELNSAMESASVIIAFAPHETEVPGVREFEFRRASALRRSKEISVIRVTRTSSGTQPSEFDKLESHEEIKMPVKRPGVTKAFVEALGRSLSSMEREAPFRAPA